MKKYLVFDVESVGLHGEGFAVGWTLVNRKGKELDFGLYYSPPEKASGDREGREWIAENVKIDPNQESATHRALPIMVRTMFWEVWMIYKKQKDITLWADCLWPVEARFLCRCIDDGMGDRNWDGPYPFHDIATLRFAAGFDPLGTFPRLSNEEPKHDPLADARQSARLLLEALIKLGIS